MAIDTVESLQEHLQWAIQVELSTVPTYLYAMYSIDDATSDPYRLVRSIAVEEMLHASIAANVLVAVGGEPRFYDPAVVPSYPMALPHHSPELTLNLEPCSAEFIERVCLPIEHPHPVDGVPEDDDFETISQFYLAVEQAIEHLDHDGALFENPRVDRQLANPRYYSPVEFDDEDSGGLQAVEDRESAFRAVETVIHQGEGLREEKYADPAHHELTHYYKFKQIADGTYPLGTVRPVLVNPTTDDLPAALRPVSTLFDAAYSYTFVLIDSAYSTTDAASKDAMVDDLYTVMSEVLSPVARFLTATPVGDDREHRAAPTFDYYRFDDDRHPTAQLQALVAPVVERHTELAQLDDVVSRLDARP